MYRSSTDKFHIIIAYCEDIYGRHCIEKITTLTSTYNLP